MKHALIALILTAFAAHAEDYGHLWWADGLRGASRALHVQTSHYGMAFDTTKANITRLGPIAGPATYADAAAQTNDLIAALPEAKLVLTARVGEKVYTCTRAAANLGDHPNYPVRLIDGGRFLNRFDILGLEFTDDNGDKLDATARLEVAAWPSHLHLSPQVVPKDPSVKLDVRINLTALGETRFGEATHGASLHFPWGTLAPSVVKIDAQHGSTALPAGYDPILGGYVIDLPEEHWNIAEQLDRLDRFPVSVENTSDEPITVPLIFAFSGGFQGITGMCPMLRDATGQPTGIPVQISKNWHKHKDQPMLYEGGWFHAITQVPLAPREVWRGELAIAYARWGGVPSVSHAQLSLIGWGGNQRWDQCAIGSFGESICYDPDVSLNRSMIDDVRPLMLRSMNDGQWEWTHNVGGGDFLVYHDAAGAKQFLTRVKTAYLAHGPNLSHVVYAGTTADGKIDARIDVQSPRSDDINRTYHRVRYDVRAATPFKRLALYQLGADHYNDHQFTTIAHGNADGLTEQWETARGGKRYLREAFACDGDAPWLALLGGLRPEALTKGAWADRALVVRAWKARIGGKDVPTPFAAVYGTENGPHSANIELVPPPGTTELLPGDFVEAEIELLILPQRADDYYGPNTALKEALTTHGGTWKLADQFAKANDLKVDVQRGTLRRKLPVEIEVDADQRAEFTISGGAGYVPISFHGLTSPTGHKLLLNGTPVDQSVHGNDFWQTELDPVTRKYTLTYNVPLDGPQEHKLHFAARARTD